MQISSMNIFNYDNYFAAMSSQQAGAGDPLTLMTLPQVTQHRKRERERAATRYWTPIMPEWQNSNWQFVGCMVTSLLLLTLF